MTLKVLQIGYRGIGRKGLEALQKLESSDEIELEVVALAETDFEKLEEAKEKHKASGIKFFSDIENAYMEMDGFEDPVMVYDAGKVGNRSDNLFRSVEHGFYHLTEKPPSLKRDQHLSQASLESAMWKIDYLEQENPVVQKTRKLVKNREIDSLEVFRASSSGIQKYLAPIKFSDLKGGSLMNQLLHEKYVLNLLEKSSNQIRLDEFEVETGFQPYFNKQKLETIQNNPTTEIAPETATAQLNISIDKDPELEFHTCWLGATEKLEDKASELEEDLNHELIRSEPKELEDEIYLDQTARFFVLKGEKSLLGDLMHRKLFDLDKNKEIELLEYETGELYRGMKKAAENALNQNLSSSVKGKQFLEFAFDVKQSISGGNYLDEYNESMDLLQKKVGVEKQKSKPTVETQE
ncbi:MAG: hypothetical protein ABEJ83_05035 [Candidatus Nanohaloarchaea archaeon]